MRNIVFCKYFVASAAARELYALLRMAHDAHGNVEKHGNDTEMTPHQANTQHPARKTALLTVVSLMVPSIGR